MINYYLTSFFMHVALFLLLTIPVVNTSSGTERIELNIIEKPKTDQMRPILPTPRKYAKPGEGANNKKNSPQIDLTDYAAKLKSIVDPIFVSKLDGLDLHNLTVTIQFYPNESGRIGRISLAQSSGNSTLDNIALKTIEEVGLIPPPPASLVKEGILWTFTI